MTSIANEFFFVLAYYGPSGSNQLQVHVLVEQAY